MDNEIDQQIDEILESSGEYEHIKSQSYKDYYDNDEEYPTESIKGRKKYKPIYRKGRKINGKKK